MQIIHPGQIDTVQRCFSPSPERVEWAQELVAAFEVHTHSGKVRILDFQSRILLFFQVKRPIFRFEIFFPIVRCADLNIYSTWKWFGKQAKYF